MDQDHHSNDAPLEPWVDPALEARLVALILGEASEFEKAELLSAIDAQPELKAFYDRISSTHHALNTAESPTASSSDSSWKLPADKREKLLEQFRSPVEILATDSTLAASTPRLSRVRSAPWLAIAAAVVLLALAALPLTLSRRAFKVAQSERATGLMVETRGESEIETQTTSAPERQSSYWRKRPSSGSAPLTVAESDSRGGAAPPTTWGRFGNRNAGGSTTARPDTSDDAFDVAAVDPGTTGDWDQGITLAKKPAISWNGTTGLSPDDPSPAEFSLQEHRPDSTEILSYRPSTDHADDPFAGGEPAAGSGEKRDDSLIASTTASPTRTRTTALADPPADTAPSDQFASLAVPAPSVSFEAKFAIVEQTVEEFGEIAQRGQGQGQASEADAYFGFGGTSLDRPMPAAGRLFGRQPSSPADPSPLVTELHGSELALSQSIAEESQLPTGEPASPSTELQALVRPTTESRVDLSPQPPTLNSPVQPTDSPTATFFAGGAITAIEDRAANFTSDAGLVTGYGVLDGGSGTPSIEGLDPSAAGTERSDSTRDELSGSDMEDMDLAAAELEPRKARELEGWEAGEPVTGSIGGGGGVAGAPRDFSWEKRSKRALFDGHAIEAAPGQEEPAAKGDKLAEVAKAQLPHPPTPLIALRSSSHKVAELPHTPTLGVDFAWDSQPGGITRSREPSEAVGEAELAPGSRQTRGTDENVVAQPMFEEMWTAPDSRPALRFAENAVPQGLAAGEGEEVATDESLELIPELARGSERAFTGVAGSSGRGTESLNEKFSKHERFDEQHGAAVNGHIALDDVALSDGTVRRLMSDSNERLEMVQEKLEDARQIEDSEALARSDGEPSSRTRTPAPDGVDRPQGIGSHWYDFDVDSAGREFRPNPQRTPAGGEEVEQLTTVLPSNLSSVRGSQVTDLTQKTPQWAENATRDDWITDSKSESIFKSDLAENLVAAKDATPRYRFEGRKEIAELGDLPAQQPEEESKVRLRTKAAPDLSLETVTSAEPFSTFSLNVSDVSFKLARTALLENSSFPDSSKVRVEEFVNAFDYGDPSPALREKVACNIDQSAHPFLQQRNLMRISMQTAAEGRAASQALRLTILLDKSGSMERADREESVLRTMQALSTHLGAADKVTAIAFARQPHLIADQLGGDRAGELVGLVAATPSEGGTNLEEALRLADTLATRQFEPGAINRIVLITDGAANLGDAAPESLKEKVVEMRQRGIAFDACGVGANGLNDTVLEALTREGDGRYYFLDRPEDADAKFVRQLAGALRPAAKNVKVQVQFNPDRVTRYRLAGFEKHRLNKEDFRNDKVDAAEMAAAESGNALYQFEADPQGSGDIGAVSVRFLDTSSGQMVERRWQIPYQAKAPRLEDASPAMQLAATAGLLGEKLKGGPSSEAIDLGELSPITNQLRAKFTNDQEVQQLIKMVEAATSLTNG